MANFSKEDLEKIKTGVAAAKKVPVDKPKSKKKESWVQKLKRSTQMAIHGKNYAKVTAKRKAAQTAKHDTVRTKATEKELKKSLSKKEIKKLRGK